MAPSPSTEVATALPAEAQRLLLQMARAAIARQLELQLPAPDLQTLEAALEVEWNQPAACFVTLHEADTQRLRGCIGTLEADQPLAQAVTYFAQQAAFHDPRFRPLARAELAATEIEISVLSPLTPLRVGSEAELLQRLAPGVDGLWLKAGGRRATFLPQVWQQLPEPEQFVAQLKLKAGLSPDSWGQDFHWWRFGVQHFSEADLKPSVLNRPPPAGGEH